MIPGSDLLDLALSVIDSQEISYYQASSRTLNSVGQYITTYNTPISLFGSFQPVPRQLYELYGLDLQRTYYTFYVSSDLIDLQREVSGDQLVFNSQRFQCQSNNDWFAVDGWKGVLCVLLGPA